MTLCSTQKLLNALRDSNPGVRVTEDHVRSAIRRGKVAAPALFAGRFAWSKGEADDLARALGLKNPHESSCSSSGSRRKESSHAS